jgi:hypothetical protein
MRAKNNNKNNKKQKETPTHKKGNQYNQRLGYENKKVFARNALTGFKKFSGKRRKT